MELNKYQTAITEELTKMYPQEVIDQLYDIINKKRKGLIIWKK